MMSKFDAAVILAMLMKLASGILEESVMFSTSHTSSDLETLRKAAYELPSGPINSEASSTICELLSCCWDRLGGSQQQSTTVDKLARMESLEWHPPCLTFRLERHGATVCGSSRAALHFWAIDVVAETATCDPASGYRQLYPKEPRLDVKPLAEEIAQLVISRSDDPRLKWCERDKVRVRIGEIIEALGAKQTVSGRRRRFRLALAERLKGHGWNESSANVYVRSLPAKPR